MTTNTALAPAPRWNPPLSTRHTRFEGAVAAPARPSFQADFSVPVPETEKRETALRRPLLARLAAAGATVSSVVAATVLVTSLQGPPTPSPAPEAAAIVMVDRDEETPSNQMPTVPYADPADAKAPISDEVPDVPKRKKSARRKAHFAAEAAGPAAEFIDTSVGYAVAKTRSACRGFYERGENVEVDLSFAPSGEVTAVDFKGNPAETCALSYFKKVRVPSFKAPRWNYTVEFTF